MSASDGSGPAFSKSVLELHSVNIADERDERHLTHGSTRVEDQERGTSTCFLEIEEGRVSLICRQPE